MKISGHDKQRLQLGLAMIIGGAAVLYAYFSMLIFPLRETRIKNLSVCQENQDKIDKAKMALKAMPAIKADIVRLRADLAATTNRFVIRPVLGSTLVSVQNILEPMAQKCGLQVDSCVERGRMDVPGNNTAADVVIQRYLVELSAVGSYGSVRDFVQTVEQTNAYVCVTDVDISGRPEMVMKHKVRICMEWLVFGERKAEGTP